MSLLVMYTKRMDATHAMDAVRKGRFHSIFHRVHKTHWPELAREQVWFNAGFQEQLVLFELCRYAPSPSCGIYRSWRQRVSNALQGS
jgi:dual specificity phosphatase 12